ncbi:hypothetical protein HYW66_02340 [Candidatus Microgenomates bacterium]|nr:hypothetical protein [Candidatus Microgenomates bacterium]
MRRNRSRILRKVEKQSKRNFILTVAGTILIIIAIFKLGIPLLAQIGQSNIQTQSDKPSFIQPPQLDPLPIATNSATIKISGLAITDKEIEVFVGNSLVNTIKSDHVGKFEIASLKLNSGQNLIKARTRDNDNTSDFSPEQTVIFDDTGPMLEVTNPTSNQSFAGGENTVEVRGKTDVDSTVTVNDFRAIVDSEGKFSYLFKLTNGENIINIKSLDPAGNETSLERKVNFSP